MAGGSALAWAVACVLQVSYCTLIPHYTSEFIFRVINYCLQSITKQGLVLWITINFAHTTPKCRSLIAHPDCLPKHSTVQGKFRHIGQILKLWASFQTKAGTFKRTSMFLEIKILRCEMLDTVCSSPCYRYLIDWVFLLQINHPPLGRFITTTCVRIFVLVIIPIDSNGCFCICSVPFNVCTNLVCWFIKSNVWFVSYKK